MLDVKAAGFVEMKLTIPAVALLLLAACSVDQAANSGDAGERISGGRIQQLLTGNTLISTPGDTTAWAVYYDADGTEYGKYGDDSDSGQWRVADDLLCSNWSTWGDGERCFALYQDASNNILGYSDGVQEWSASPSEGDSLGLAGAD